MASQTILGDFNPIVVSKLESNVSKSSHIQKDDKESFQKVMNKTQEREKVNNDDRKYDEKPKLDKADKNNVEDIRERVLNGNASKDTQSTNEMSTEEKPFIKEEFVEDIKDVINEIADAYKDVLEIDDEELISIMEELGINLFQLPLENIMKEIILEANGENDLTALLVNEDALNQLNMLKDFFNEYNLEGKLDMSAEDFNSLVDEALERLAALQEQMGDISTEDLENAGLNVLNDMVQDDVNNVVLEEDNVDTMLSNVDGTKEMVDNESLTIKGEINVNEDKKISVEITKEMNDSNEIVDTTDLDMDANDLEVTEDNLDTTEDIDNLMNTLENEISSNENGSLDSDTSDMMSQDKDLQTTDARDTQREVANDEASAKFYDKFIANLEDSLGVGEGDIINELSHVREMREVVEQIVDKIKVNINKDAVSMKMMLTPEHLGKLELEVTSNSGVMTAKFVVESVTAKEAIESGMQILVEKFKEQGVVVEAVEVSIANYDMSKENGREKGSNEYEMDIKKKKKHSKISLEDIENMENEEMQAKENDNIRKSMTATTIDYAV